MEVNQLATWLENNQHKFIFYTYWGGTGGEYVCNHLTEHLDLYNTKALTFDNAYNKSEDHDKFNSAVTNRYNFPDSLLCDSLANEFQTSEEEELNKTPFDLKTDTFIELATLITGYVDRDGYGILDKDMLQDFSNQNKKYLIRIHRILPYMELFNKSKIYLVKAGKWHGYTSLLAKTKLSSSNLIDILACTADEINHDIHYIKAHHQDWIDLYNIDLISFENVFTGEWASTEFKLNKMKFNNAMIEWDKRNTKYLNEMGIQIPNSIKRLNQELY